MDWVIETGINKEMDESNFSRKYRVMSCSVKSNSIKKAMNCFMACGDKWTRTTDSRIFSPMLYQLSYITLL